MVQELKETILLKVDYFNNKIACILDETPKKIVVTFGNATTIAGQCYQWPSRPDYAKLRFSLILAKIVDDEELNNTIIHELTHAYNLKYDNHGKAWQAIAKRVGDALGYDLRRTYKMTKKETIALEEFKNKKLEERRKIVW